MEKSKPSKKGKKEKGIYAYYIELESPLDLARQVFDFTSRSIRAIKDGKNYMLMSIGEKIGELRLIYYVRSNGIGNFFVYTPDSYPSEKYEFLDKLVTHTDYKSYKAPVVEILSNPYTEAKDLKKAGKIIKVEAKDPATFIKSIAGNAQDEDSAPKLYAFYKGNDHIIGTFEFFHEGNARIFTYAKTAIREKFSTLRYNYTNDTIEPANSFAEKPAVYIRIINLKNPFPFF